jgi:aromatic ring-cleaving dioxygenase
MANNGKISSLPAALAVTGEEFIEIVQRNSATGVLENKRLLLSKIRSAEGKSAYQIAVVNGFEGTEAEWLATLDGRSAFEVAKDLGFAGTESAWLESLIGPAGKSAYDLAVEQGYGEDLPQWLGTLKGDSAYAVAVAAGYAGTEAEWLSSLVGPRGFVGPSAYESAVFTGFEGTEEQWLETLKGLSAYQLAVVAGFEGDEATWQQSLQGKSAYQIAVQNGYLGDETMWLETLKGVQGDKGDTGFIHVIAELASVEELPDPSTFNTGDSFLIQKRLYTISAGAWVDAGDIAGPQGWSAYELAMQQGFEGTMEEWLESIRGIDGIGLRILGSLPSVVYLPMDPLTNEAGDTYIIDYKMYVWDSKTWSPVGQVGPAGKSAYQLAVQQGYAGTLTQWLNSLKGKSNYQLAVDNGYTGDLASWLETLKVIGPQGDKGEKGDKGDTGSAAAAVVLKGELASTADLPIDATVADAWIINTELHVWTGDAWSNIGNILGPQGIQGVKGDKGDKGDVGPAGKSAYQVAVDGGFLGTELEWLASLLGETGQSAYDLAVMLGFGGTEEEWLTSLKGANGEQGVPGLKGDPGAGLIVKGLVATVDLLPETANENESWVVDRNLYSWIGGAWVDLGLFVGIQGDKGDQGDVGPQGKSAYDLAVEAGFIGTEPEWRESLKGDQGDVGPAGPPATAKGSLESSADLDAVENPQDGDAYLIQGHLWLRSQGNWVDMGDLTGPQGDKGIQGDKGDAGPGLTVKGTLASNEERLALVDMTDGDTYMVQSHLWVYSAGVWQDLGSLKGDKGDIGNKGDQGDMGPAGEPIKPKGYLANASDLDALVDPEVGDLYIVGTGEVYSRSAAGWVFLGVITGPQGPQGPMGPGIKILGKLASTAELPTTGVLGEGYLIGLNFWGWTGTAYEDLGPVQGPKGDKGDQGIQGIQGIQGFKGDKGDQGTLWLVFERDPGAVDGRAGDYFLNSATLQFFLKTSATLWAPMGYLGGGNVYDSSYDGKQKVRLDGQWVDLAVLEAPKDGGRYMRRNGEWIRLNTYDLVVSSATTVLDLSVSQVFTIDNSTNRTITIVNPPAATRAMTVVIVINGSTGAITWPANVFWNQGAAPTLGTTTTVVTLLWDGTRWIGTTGASF